MPAPKVVARGAAAAATRKANDSILNVLQPLSKFSADYQRLAAAALEAQTNGYAPYSNYLVGAALLHMDGSITPGCNWENCIYQGSCAERCAILAANAAGKRRATAVAVFGASALPQVKAKPDALVTPCGLCRQMLTEVSHLSCVDLDVLLVAANRTDGKVVKLSSLLPSSFGPTDIGVDLTAWGRDRSLPEPRNVVNTKKKSMKRSRDEQ
jgi:cytidine deaminase